MKSVNSTTAITHHSIINRIPEDEAIAARIRKVTANLDIVRNHYKHDAKTNHTCS